MRTVAFFLLFALVAGELLAQMETQVYPNPTVDGGRLDLCLVWGGQCGEPAADAFCQGEGFDDASAWEPDNDIGAVTPTIVLTSRAICSHADCDGFRSITCARAAPAADQAVRIARAAAPTAAQSSNRGASWVDVNRDGPIIGQIFFSTGRSDLDDKGYAELQKIKQPYERAWSHPSVPPMTFEFRGFADHRRFQGEGGNRGLSAARARAVMNYVDEMFRGGVHARPPKFKPIVKGYGVHPSSRPGYDLPTLADFRRVDILAPPPIEPKNPPPTKPQPDLPALSDRWRARILLGACAGGLGAEADFMRLEFIDLKNKVQMVYDVRAAGVGFSTPICFQGRSKYIDFRTSKLSGIRDFEGPASHLSLQLDPGTVLPTPSLSADHIHLVGPYKNAGADLVRLEFNNAGIKGPGDDPSAGGGASVTIGGLHPHRGPTAWKPTASDPSCQGLALAECAPADEPVATGPGDVLGPEVEGNEPPIAEPSIDSGEDAPVDDLEPWTTQDIIDPRIDVQAQYALMRMFRGEPDERADASHILGAIKAGTLGGIYQEDQQVPALRASSLGSGWWKILPPASASPRIDGRCMIEPASKPPIIVMRRGAEKNQSQYDLTLRASWWSCGLDSASAVRPYEVTLPNKQPEPKPTVCPMPSDHPVLGVAVYSEGEPLRNAAVILRQPDGGDIHRATDANGGVTFSDILPGQHRLRVFVPEPFGPSSDYDSFDGTIHVHSNCVQSMVVYLGRNEEP